MVRTTLLLLLAACGAALSASAQNTPTAAAADWWKKLDFLLGNWTGTAKDTPHGAGAGGYSFEKQLNDKIIVRRNHAEYSTGVKHDDLMIIYADSPTDKPRAIYFDTEGHVIRYDLAFPEANKVVFESSPSEPGPHYRLTYWLNGANVDGKFEVGSGQGDYKTYLQWTSKRS
jgi:hypothetical protein